MVKHIRMFECQQKCCFVSQVINTLIKIAESPDPCEHCYCMQGDIVCAVEACMGPLEGDEESCEPLAPEPGTCCPSEYKCGKWTRKKVITACTTITLKKLNLKLFLYRT